MNLSQKKMLKSWSKILRAFAKREWFSLFVSSGLGVLAAQVIHLIGWDHSFQDFLASLYESKVFFDDPHYYVPYLTVILIATVLAIGPFTFGYISRALTLLAYSCTIFRR